MSEISSRSTNLAPTSCMTRRGMLAGTIAGVGVALAGLPASSGATPLRTLQVPVGTGAETMAMENAVEHALNAFIWYRSDVPHDVSQAYWRDVHGIMVVRVPGMWLYRQMRLAPNRADLWGPPRGIAFDVPREAQPHGIPHFLFRTDVEQAAFNDHPIIQEQIFQDERNFVDRVGSQSSPLGSARTLVDHLGSSPVQGAPRYPTFALCFVPAADVASTAAFHDYLAERVALAWSTRPGVLRLRVQPLQRYDAGVWNSPGVSHEWPSDRSYLGWIEVTVKDETVLRDLMRGSETDEHARMIAEIHTYPAREIFTLVAGGLPTEVGLRGYPAVQTIVAAGADNQRTREALATVYGDVARGLEPLR